MINTIWFLILVGIIVGIINDRLEEVTQAAMDSASLAVQLCIGLLAFGHYG